MKFLFITLLLSSTVFAKTESLQLVQDVKNEVIILKNDKMKIVIPTMFKIEEDTISAYTSNNQEVTIATIDKENSTSDLILSNEKLDVKIIKNKTKKVFRTTSCTHMGCIPFPHFEKYDVQLLEITTNEGNVVCWDQNNVENRLEKSVLTQGHCL
jgi:NurA-like 5'-3' nuclease